MKIDEFKPQFVEEIPKEMEQGVLYIMLKRIFCLFFGHIPYSTYHTNHFVRWAVKVYPCQLQTWFTRMKKPAILFILNFISYIFLTWDFRATSQANYLQAPLVNMVIGALGFTILKKIQEAKTWIERMAYIVSCGVGVDAGIWISKIFLGQ